MRRLVERVAQASGKTTLSLLDVACASGDVPLQLQQQFASDSLTLNVTLLDRAATHLPRMQRAVVGDALALPFPGGAFDVVTCSLFVHHLEPNEIKVFANEALRVCRIAFVINDLVRSRVHHVLTHLALPMFRSRLTRHDARVSVQRSYTPGELRSMLAEAVADRIEITRFFLYRMGVIVWKRDLNGL